MSSLPAGYERHRTEDMTFVCRAGDVERLREMGLTDLFTIEDMIASGARGGRGRIFTVPSPEEMPGDELVLKQILHGGILSRVNRERFLGPERVLGELRVTQRARERGVPVPEVAFAAWTPGFSARLFLATVRVPGSRSLEDILCVELPGPSRRQVLAAAAQAIREMHEGGLKHADLNLRNVMLAETEAGPEGFVLDLDRSRFPLRLSDGDRAANLTRLLRSLEKSPAAARVGWTTRARFLLDYAGGDRLRFRALATAIKRRAAATLPFHRLAWWVGWR